jgi:hypothetical protein
VRAIAASKNKILNTKKLSLFNMVSGKVLLPPASCTGLVVMSRDSRAALFVFLFFLFLDEVTLFIKIKY